MLVIVLSHFSLYGPWHLTDQKGLRRTFAWLVMQMGHAGVTVFFAVTGYYMVRGAYRFSHLAKVQLQTFIYSLIWLAVAFTGISTGHLQTVSSMFAPDQVWHTVQKSLMPILTREYWFITSYFMVMLLAPILNAMVKHISDKQLLALIAGMVSVSALPILGLGSFWPYDYNVYAITCYLIGCYLRVRPATPHRGMLPLCLAAMFLLVFWFGLDHLILSSQTSTAGRYLGWGTETIINLRTPGMTVGLLIMILTLDATRAWHNPWINTMASGMFGVYLLHENQFGRLIIWELVGRLIQRPTSPLMAILAGLPISCCVRRVDLSIHDHRSSHHPPGPDRAHPTPIGLVRRSMSREGRRPPCRPRLPGPSPHRPGPRNKAPC